MLGVELEGDEVAGKIKRWESTCVGGRARHTMNLEQDRRLSVVYEERETS